MEKSCLLKEFNPAFLNPHTPFDGTAAEAILHPQLAALAEDCVRDWKCFSTYANGVESLDIEPIAITPAFVVEMLKAVAKHLKLDSGNVAEFVNDGMTGLTSGQGHLVKLVMAEV